MASAMEGFLDRALKIRPGEGTKVGLMALYSANAIGAIVVGRTVRDTLFLSSGVYSKDDLPLMYILNSIAVALLSWGYSKIADGMRRDRLNAGIAAGWAVVMAGFYLAAVASPRLAAPALYVAVEAMGALVVIQFWTFAQDVFTSREAKRLFGIIGAGGQVANVVYGALASTVSRHFGAESMLFICAGNLAACAVLAVYVGRKYSAVAQASPARAKKTVTSTRLKPVAPKGPRQAAGLSALATPHLVGIAAIAVLSALAVNLVDFQFKAAAEANFANKKELGAFFGQFYAWCGAAALAIQMGVTSRVLERFGILASLLPLPIGLVLGSVVAPFFPGIWFSSLAKGSDSIFRYTMNDASMQLLYVPAPAHLRGQAKALIDGILKPMTGVVAGLLLTGMKLLRDSFGLFEGQVNNYTTAIILTLVLAWIVLLVRAKREYVHSLMDTLQKRRLDLQSQNINADQATGEALAKVLRSDDALAILHALQLLPHVRGRDFSPLVAELLDHRVSSLRAAAADFLAEYADARYAPKLRERLNDDDPWCVASAIGAICALEKEKALTTVKPFLGDPRPAIRAAAVVGLVRNAGINGILEAAEELKRQLNAQSPVERELAASVLGAIGVPTFYDSLIRYLEDPSASVRRAALTAASRLKSPELVPYLLRLLARRDASREVAICLAQFGAGIEDALGEAMADPEKPVELRRAVPGVLGRIATKDAADKLQAALEFNDPPLRAAAARALARLMRRRSDIVIRREVIQKAIWFELDQAEDYLDLQRSLELPMPERTAPVRSARGEGAAVLLALSLTEERDRSVQRALVLLELFYPQAALDVVAENLRSDSPARRANAVEVLDNTLREDLKKRLIPLIEDRVAKQEKPRGERLEWIANLINGPHAWIGACAAQYAAETRLEGCVPALTEALRSRTAYVREASAAALARLAPAASHDLLVPLANDPAKSVRRVVEGALVLSRLASA